MIPIDKLKPGSKWQKSVSKKIYEVINLGIDTTTNNAIVIYKKAGDGDDDTPLTRPLGEFLGTIAIGETTEKTTKHYVPRFSPLEETT